MRNPRLGALCILLLLLIPPAIQANPGGNGDANRDMQCGGSCHGDPSLSIASSAGIEISLDRASVYAGGTVGVSITVSDGELSNTHLVGIFLLSSMNGANDHPDETGWRILQDPNGGKANSVELVRHSTGYPLVATWIMQAPSSEGSPTLYAAIHHGASPNTEGLAYFGVNSTGLTVDVGPVPDNLPQLHPDWTPPKNRQEGVATEFTIRTVNATDVTVEWMLEGDENFVATSVQNKAAGEWIVTLPATLSGTNISYRVSMSNNDYTELTPWLQLTTEEKGFEVNLLALRLQMVALMLLAVTVSISLQRLLLKRSRPDSVDEQKLEIPQLLGMPELPTVQPLVGGPPLPVGGLPPGWTAEQWAHYGHQYHEGGGQ